MEHEQNPPDVRIGNDREGKYLGDVAERRAEILSSWANNPEVCQGILDDDELPNQALQPAVMLACRPFEAEVSV